jgi:hypothetical protein
VPLINARIYRVDVARHFQMRNPVYFYYDCLGEKRYYKRLNVAKTTLTYNTKIKQLIFYDKLAEAKAKNVIIPEVYNNANLLRYEMRFIGRLSKQFNLPEVTASTLFNEHFYIEITKQWFNEYQSIQKIKKVTLNSEDMKTPDDYLDQLIIERINEKGLNEVFNEIEYLRANKTFNKPEYYSRLKKRIKDLCNKPNLSEQNSLIDELDREIKQVKQHYR